MNTKEQLESFALELKALLKKYDVTIVCSPDYSPNSLYANEHTFAVNNETNETRILSKGTCVSAKDI